MNEEGQSRGIRLRGLPAEGPELGSRGQLGVSHINSNSRNTRAFLVVVEDVPASLEGGSWVEFWTSYSDMGYTSRAGELWAFPAL